MDEQPDRKITYIPPTPIPMNWQPPDDLKKEKGQVRSVAAYIAFTAGLAALLFFEIFAASVEAGTADPLSGMGLAANVVLLGLCTGLFFFKPAFRIAVVILCALEGMAYMWFCVRDSLSGSYEVFPFLFMILIKSVVSIIGLLAPSSRKAFYPPEQQ